MDLQVFKNNGFEIRVLGDSNNPLFVAKDICQALGLSDVSMSLQKLDDDEKGTKVIGTLGGNQKMSVITESGMYALIMRSNKPEAKSFRKWVTSEVLPEIRKTGSYNKKLTRGEMLVMQAQAMLEAERKLQDHDVRLLQLEAKAETINATVLPKTGYMSINELSHKTGLTGNIVKKIIDIVNPKTGSATKTLDDGSLRPYTTFKAKKVLKFAERVKQTAKPVGRKKVMFVSPLLGGHRFQIK
jgi:prophage antirepressor-like protein